MIEKSFEKAPNFDSTNGKIRNCESLSKRRLPQKNYLKYFKSYATWRDNQRQKKLAAQPLGHLPERISSKDWPITA